MRLTENIIINRNDTMDLIRSLENENLNALDNSMLINTINSLISSYKFLADSTVDSNVVDKFNELSLEVDKNSESLLKHNNVKIETIEITNISCDDGYGDYCLFSTEDASWFVLVKLFYRYEQNYTTYIKHFESQSLAKEYFMNAKCSCNYLLD